jgi:phenylacetic acid degradation operon negative regulatory protein
VEEILDDMDSRPGSTTSLLRTVVGVYLRELGGWIPVAQLIDLMEALGVPAPRTRTALVRVKRKGLLLPESRDGVAGYALAPEAVPMLARGDRRIYEPRSMGSGDEWCLVSFSIPEEQRSVRHQLRRRLAWIGCGTVGPALWICPAFLAGEVEEILVDLGVRDHAVVFRTRRPEVAGSLAAAAAGWWDLGELATLHRQFLAEAEPLIDSLEEGDDDDAAFAAYIRSIDAWRILPYVDPGLPADLLPSDWPGERSVALFARLRDGLGAAATRYVGAVTGRAVGVPGAAAQP